MQDHPTLLRHPVLAPHRLQGEEVLPLPPDAYSVVQSEPGWWKVVEVATASTIYEGPGPVEVVRSPAPF